MDMHLRMNFHLHEKCDWHYSVVNNSAPSKSRIKTLAKLQKLALAKGL